MIDDDAAPRSDDDGAPSRPRYEPPSVEVLGTVEELTQGPAGVGGDLNSMVITF